MARLRTARERRRRGADRRNRRPATIDRRGKRPFRADRVTGRGRSQHGPCNSRRCTRPLAGQLDMATRDRRGLLSTRLYAWTWEGPWGLLPAVRDGVTYPKFRNRPLYVLDCPKTVA